MVSHHAFTVFLFVHLYDVLAFIYLKLFSNIVPNAKRESRQSGRETNVMRDDVGKKDALKKKLTKLGGLET